MADLGRAAVESDLKRALDDVNDLVATMAADDAVAVVRLVAEVRARSRHRPA